MEYPIQSKANPNGSLASMRWARFDNPELEAAFATWRADFHIYGSACIMSVNLLLVLAGALIDVQRIPSEAISRLLAYRLTCATGLGCLIVFLYRRRSAKGSPASPLLVARIFLTGITWGICFYSLIARNYTIYAGHNDSMIIVPAFALFSLVLLPRSKYCLVLMAIIFHFAMAFIHSLPEVPAWFAMQSSFSLFIFVIAGSIGHFWRHSTERRLFEYAWRERRLDP